MVDTVSNADALAELNKTGVDVGGVEARTQAQIGAGKGVIRVDNAFIGRSKNNRLQLTAACVVVAHEAGEEFVGKKYCKNWGLTNEENLKWLKGDLLNLEIEVPGSNDEIVKLPALLTGLTFEVSFVENEGYPPNCYINANALKATLGESSQPASGDTF